MTIALVLLLVVGTHSLVQAKVNLVFRQSDSPGEVKGLKKAIDEFNQLHPDIQVRFETVPWSDSRDQFIRESVAGSGPDVLQLAFVWTRDLAKAGSLLKLNSLIKNDPLPNGIDDFVGLEMGQLDDGIYGIPWTVDTFAMVYRADILQKAGIKTFPDTWKDFQQTVIKLAESRGQPGFGFPAGSASGGGMWFLANYFLWSNGYDFVKRDTSSGVYKLGVDVENVADAIRYFKTFFDKGASPRSLIGVDSWADPTLLHGIQSGTYPIIFIPPATLRAILASNPELPLRSGLVPRGKVRRISHMGGRALGISVNTKHPKEAWELVKFLTSKNVFEKYYTEQFPAQRALLQQINFDPAFRGYAELLQYARSFNDYIVSPAPVGAMWDATNREFAAAFSGQKDPERAARDLLESIQKLLK
ncbi:MAG: sugar ABC transporter substrate-binding protein [Firmicutes bacterium]|nr:sugar ABC transporter substrate-binding protein [Bacillota bacterium]